MTNESNENKIQLLIEKDIDRVCNIWLIGSLTSHGFIPAGFWYARLPEIKKQFEKKNEDKEHYEIYVHKEKDGIIRGFVVVQCKNKRGETKNYMEELFVDLPYQRKGIATKLLEHITKDKTFLETHVYQLNTGAIIFYAKQGFRIKKEQQNCVRVEMETGQWKLLMRWDKCKKEIHQTIDDKYNQRR